MVHCFGFRLLSRFLIWVLFCSIYSITKIINYLCITLLRVIKQTLNQLRNQLWYKAAQEKRNVLWFTCSPLGVGGGGFGREGKRACCALESNPSASNSRHNFLTLRLWTDFLKVLYFSFYNCNWERKQELCFTVLRLHGK